MIVILMVGLLGAQGSPVADVGEASQAYSACLDHAAEARDDGRTNPRFLARRIALQCRPELTRLVVAATAGRSSLIREQLYQDRVGQEEAAAEAAVVRRREGAAR